MSASSHEELIASSSDNISSTGEEKEEEEERQKLTHPNVSPIIGFYAGNLLHDTKLAALALVLPSPKSIPSQRDPGQQGGPTSSSTSSTTTDDEVKEEKEGEKEDKLEARVSLLQDILVVVGDRGQQQQRKK